MEASPEPLGQPDKVFLNPEVIELYLSLGMPIEPEKARWIWLMNHCLHLPGENPESTEGDW